MLSPKPYHHDITVTRAQLGLILCLRSVVPSARWTVRLRTLSDNTGAEAGVNKLYSSFPLLKKLCVLACLTGIELDAGHTPGEKKDDADWLSRWDDSQCRCPTSSRRVDCALERIWFFRSDVRLFSAQH